MDTDEKQIFYPQISPIFADWLVADVIRGGSEDEDEHDDENDSPLPT